MTWLSTFFLKIFICKYLIIYYVLCIWLLIWSSNIVVKMVAIVNTKCNKSFFLSLKSKVYCLLPMYTRHWRYYSLNLSESFSLHYTLSTHGARFKSLLTCVACGQKRLAVPCNPYYGALFQYQNSTDKIKRPLLGWWSVRNRYGAHSE